MTHSKTTKTEPNRFYQLFSLDTFFTVWIPVLVIGAFHYGTDPHHTWVHHILRRVYYLPIAVAALRMGLTGGIVVSSVVTLTYLPHAFLHPSRFDPADSLEKVMEILLYYVVGCVVGYISDLEQSQRVQLQKSLDEQQNLTKQLVRAGRLSALGEVVAGIAHEIKNPLHSLAGTAEIVDTIIPKDAEERKMWEIHQQEIQRLKKISERFLSFSRPAPLEAIELDLRDVAYRLSDLVDAEARQKNIVLETQLTDKQVMVLGDLDQLAQIALNITVNAIKAMGDNGGEIKASVGYESHQGKEMAFLRIENNGPSIADQDMEHLFDPFHSSNDGTGLGLSISSRIAEQHNGYIEVEHGGLGVIFTLYLPIHATHSD